MARPEERIEHLLSRRLDGELTAEERLELDRALIRRPEQRRLADELERIDALCAEVIRERVAADGGDPGQIPLPATVKGAQRGRSRIWWCVPTALAACVGWLVWTAGIIGPGDDGGRAVGTGEQATSGTRVTMTGDTGGQAASGTGAASHRAAPHLTLPKPGDYANGREVGKAADAGPFRHVSTGTNLTRGRRDTGVYGVIGDDGRVYLIEVDRVRSLRTPAADKRVRVPLGDL